MKNRPILIAPVALGLSLVLALLTAPVGCGDSDSGDDELPLAQYCPELLKVFCEKRISCYSEAALAYEGYATQSECVNALADLCQNQPASWQASIDAGRKEYQPGKADACFAAVRASGCDDLTFENTNLLDECQDVFTSLVTEGGACRSWAAECGEGLWCEPNGFPQITCLSGVCSTAQAAGETCNFQEGTICEAGLLCSGGTCKSPVGEGANCASISCAAGLFCGSDSTCHRIVGIGNACDDTNGDPCDGYSICTDGTCLGRPKVGEACGGDLTTDCWASWCDPTQNTCVDYPRQGEACGSDTTTICASGWCDSNVDGTCQAFKGVGQTCVENRECQTAICNPDTGVCAEEYCPGS